MAAHLPGPRMTSTTGETVRTVSQSRGRLVCEPRRLRQYRPSRPSVRPSVRLSVCLSV